MNNGHHASAIKIDYKELSKTSAEAARHAVVDYWGNNGHHVSDAARTVGINRCAVDDILQKWAEGDLDALVASHEQDNQLWLNKPH
jgi:transposase